MFFVARIMLIGHQRIWNYLQQSARQNKLAHAYLFVGPREVGKMTLALEFVKWLLCVEKKIEDKTCGQCKSCQDIARNQHPDVFVLAAKQEEKKDILKNREIGIDEIRDLQHQLSLSPYSSSYKIAIIEEAASLSYEAGSAFLKTLEEPSSRSLIILISSAWQSLLSTIISRCQMIKFLPVPEKEIREKLKSLIKKRTDFEKIVKLAAGRSGRAIRLLQEKDFLTEQEKNLEEFEKILKADLIWRFEKAREISQNTVLAQEILSQWLLWLRDRILESNGCPELMTSGQERKSWVSKYPLLKMLDACREIQKTQAILSNPSFNARLALEILMMKI